MTVARDDPDQALEPLDVASFEASEPGIDPDEVHAWVDAQRTWLTSRLQTATTVSIETAVASLSVALDEIKHAIELEARSAESRAGAAADQAQRHCAALIRDAERVVAKQIKQTRRALREEAALIRRAALDDAERILERAGNMRQRF